MAERHGNPTLRCSREMRNVGQLVHRWESWAEFVADVADTTDNGRGRCSSKDGTAYFCGGTESLDQALQLARDGWSEHRGDVMDLADRIRHEPSVAALLDQYVMTPSTVHSVSGAFPDVAAFLAGEPDNMVTFAEVEQPRAGKVVTIHVDMITGGSTDPDLLVKRGAVVVALIELLETMGFACDVWLESTNAGGKIGAAVRSITDLIHVKTAGEPLDVDSLMYAIGHPSTFRRLLFRWWEGESATVRSSFGFMSGGGYGSCGRAQMAEELGATVTLTQASHHNPETLNPENWVKEIVTGLFE